MPRRFIRHPMSIPIQICSPAASHQYSSDKEIDTSSLQATNLESSKSSAQVVNTCDVSAGGLSCESDQLMNIGEAVEVEISLDHPPFKTIGHIVWCKGEGDRYLLGIGFSDLATAYAVRMVEQVCYIEEYRQEILANEGRELSSEEAALEWISKHAADFPSHPS